MDKAYIWIYIAVAVAVAVGANSVSAIWATQINKFTSPWFLAVLLISPLVFITFGLISSRLGLAQASGTLDSLLTICTILIGLFVFQEFERLSIYQISGLGFTVLGIVLMQIHK